MRIYKSIQSFKFEKNKNKKEKKTLWEDTLYYMSLDKYVIFKT